MSFTPIRTKRAYMQIVDQITDLIKRDQFPTGSQLPSERELSERLGVGRASIREALSALQMLGVVETKHGQGTFVCADRISPSLRVDAISPYEEESPFTLLQARRAIEPAIAAMAATQRSEDDVRRLGRILDSVEDRLTEVHLFSEGDRKFHLAIAEATGNSVLVGMMSFVHELMGQGLWLTLMRDTHFATPGRWQQAWQEHRGIHEAIKGGSGQLATDRMRAHLERVEQVMIEADLVHLGRSSR